MEAATQRPPRASGPIAVRRHIEVDEMRGDVRRALDGRRLVWFGTRGEDAEALLQLPEFEASFAVIAPVRSARLSAERNVTLESLSGVRPDLDEHDVDLDCSEPMQELRRRLLREVSTRCAVVAYRPAHLVSALAFSMTETLRLIGLVKDRQKAFEHKPWVETSLERQGLRTLGWRYVADEHRSRARRLVAAGPLVLRASRASGGVGIVRVADAGEVDRWWPRDGDGFIGVAPFVEGAIPVNVSGCVHPNGVVRVHPPSVQLIGVDGCTQRPFGYCGNDFGAASTLAERALDQLDALVRQVGLWLHEERYVGAFGVDALVRDDQVHFTEVNPRFQGSSALSATIAQELGLPDLFLDHVAAGLGVPVADTGITVREWAARQPARAHLVVHNVSPGPLERQAGALLPQLPSGMRYGQVLPAGVRALPGATLCQLAIGESVTATGFDLAPRVAALVGELTAGFVPARTPSEGLSHVA